MEEKGLVASRLEDAPADAGGLPRRLYEATALGRRVYGAWSHVARLLASIATIAHQERPEYLDRLSVLRNQVFMLDHMYMSLFSTLGWILRLAVTMTLLASIHPALMLLVGLYCDDLLAGRARVERDFSLEAMLARYRSVYDQLLAGNGEPVARVREA